jgi:single-stranded-DNA-specific exonuclease
MNAASDKLWIERPVSESLDGDALQRSLEISRLAAEALVRRDLVSLDEVRNFLQAKLSSMPDPYLMADMSKAVERLALAVCNGEMISVHGDYDVDGVTGTALLVETLRSFGARVDYSIPLRLRDGYGVSSLALESCAAAGSALVITVDCGISAHAQAKRASELGLDMIITDQTVEYYQYSNKYCLFEQ